MLIEPITVYRVANYAFIIDHLVCTTLSARAAWSRPHTSVVFRLGWTLAAFFLSGAITHGFNLSDAGVGEAQAWAHGVRAAFMTLIIIPLYWLVCGELGKLPTKESYVAAIRAARDLHQKEQEARKLAQDAQKKAEEMEGRARALARAIGQKNHKISAECDRLRNLLDEELFRKKVAEDVEGMRVALKQAVHGVRNAAS
jgi:protein involved in temperature-dependent protein secretion